LGLSKEFISAPRLDDKLCSFAALWALINASSPSRGNSSEEGRPVGGVGGVGKGSIKMVALFDNEEIGSGLRYGAKSNFLQTVIERVVEIQVGVPSRKKTTCTRVSFSLVISTFCILKLISFFPRLPTLIELDFLDIGKIVHGERRRITRFQSQFQ
jgi:aspartyl aminopeptidase